MKYDIDNKKINDILDELGEEYKNLLIEKTLSQHEEYNIDNINLSTLIRLDEKAKESLVSNERKKKRDRILAMFAILGLLYSLLGVIFLFYYQYRELFNIDPINKILLSAIALGLLLSCLSIMMRSIPFSSHYKSKDTSKYFNYKIINTWKKIEGLLVELTPAEENMSLNNMISNLMEIKLLSSSDASTIKKVLNLRNQIVHLDNIEKEYTTNEIQALLRDADNIIKKLDKFENG